MKISLHTEAFNPAYFRFECGLINRMSWIQGQGYQPHAAIYVDVRFSQVEWACTHAPLNQPEGNLWLDSNAPFYGVYEKPAHLAQKNGEAVPPPRLQ